MIIISDSIKYAEKILAISPTWKEFSSDDFNPEIIDLVGDLFNNNQLSISKTAGSFFSYAFITEYSPNSQFNVLTEYFHNRQSIQEAIICLAGYGDNFKGYRDRSWISLPGNIHLTAYLNPDQPVEHFNIGFSILPANSVVQTIDSIIGLEQKARIKWVNDILIERAKVSGVLCKTQTQNDKVTGVFMGIGINVKTKPKFVPDMIVPKAECLTTFTSEKTLITEANVLTKLLTRLEVNYQTVLQGNWKNLLSFYQQRSAVIGEKVTIYSDPIEGKSVKLTEGIVTAIGENLELYIDNRQEAVIRGRIALI